MTTTTARLIEREITIRETIHEIEQRDDDPPVVRDDVTIEITRAVRSLSRRGPQPSRRIGRVEAPLMIADGRGGR